MKGAILCSGLSVTIYVNADANMNLSILPKSLLTPNSVSHTIRHIGVRNADMCSAFDCDEVQ